MATSQGRMDCPSCHGKGGTFIRSSSGPGRWVKCTFCFPKRTREDARIDALHRYLSGNRNPMAYNACIRLGWSPVSLDAARVEYDSNHSQPESLF